MITHLQSLCRSSNDVSFLVTQWQETGIHIGHHDTKHDNAISVVHNFTNIISGDTFAIDTKRKWVSLINHTLAKYSCGNWNICLLGKLDEFIGQPKTCYLNTSPNNWILG